jgi:hypothetical protein
VPIPARVYAAEKGAPFTALYFGLKNAYSEGVIKKHIDEIEKYLEHVNPKGTKEDYETSIKVLLNDIGVPDSATKIDKIEKLHDYLRLLNKQDAIHKQIQDIRREYAQ